MSEKDEEIKKLQSQLEELQKQKNEERPKNINEMSKNINEFYSKERSKLKLSVSIVCFSIWS